MRRIKTTTETEVDVTIKAQKILSCIKRTGERFGKTMICDILRGSKNEKIIRSGLDQQTTYGLIAKKKEALPSGHPKIIKGVENANGFNTFFPFIKIRPHFARITNFFKFLLRFGQNSGIMDLFIILIMLANKKPRLTKKH